MNNKQIGGIIIDAGHGGIDSGAVGNKLLEKDLTLKVSQYMQKRFQELGIPSKMTREGDEYLPKNERVKKVLSLYNNQPNILLISNHINAGGRDGCYCKLINLIFFISTIWIMNSIIFIFKCMSI